LPASLDSTRAAFNHYIVQEVKDDNVLLRIYICESDKVDHKPLYLELIERARQLGMSGSTVLRGLAGYGAAKVIHVEHSLKLSSDLPVVIEFVDTSERVKKFLATVGPLLGSGLVTEEKVVVHKYG